MELKTHLSLERAVDEKLACVFEVRGVENETCRRWLHYELPGSPKCQFKLEAQPHFAPAGRDVYSLVVFSLVLRSGGAQQLLPKSGIRCAEEFRSWRSEIG
jgi:hypothetical protein